MPDTENGSQAPRRKKTRIDSWVGAKSSTPLNIIYFVDFGSCEFNDLNASKSPKSKPLIDFFSATSLTITEASVSTPAWVVANYCIQHILYAKARWSYKTCL